MNPAHTPSSTPSASTTSSLPPEAIALAGRLFEAARRGDEESVALLTAAVQHGGSRIANLTNDKGDSLIMLAAYHGHASLVRTLLQAGADPNRLNDRGQSPLAGVVFKNERECIVALLEGGADPELGDPSALGACEIFRQEEYLAMFREQIEKSRADGTRLVNGNSRGPSVHGVEETNGVH